MPYVPRPLNTSAIEIPADLDPLLERLAGERPRQLGQVTH